MNIDSDQIKKALFRSIGTIIFAFIFSSSYTYGQTGSITGLVLLNDSVTPLSNVSVWVIQAKKGTISNAKGQFEIGFIDGEYTVQFSSIGYITWTTNVIIEEGEELNITAYLSEAVLDLPAVLITGNSMTGGEQGAKTIPGSAYYLSPRQVERFSYSDANRALRTVPGIHLQEEDGFGLRPNIGLRGTGVERSSKITIMEDGVLMAPAPYIAPAAYYFPTMGRMQAVEILKGSSQIKYGPHTTGGAIDLISTQIPDQLRAKFTLLGGTNSGRTMHAMVGNDHGQLSYMVETYQYGSDGFKKLDGGGNTGFYKQDYLGKVRWSSKATAKTPQMLTLKVGTALESSNETYLGLTQNDFENDPYRRYAASQKDLMSTDQTQVSLRHSIEISRRTQLSTTIYRNDFHRNWYKLDKVVDSTGTKTDISEILDDPNGNTETMGYITGANSHNDALQVKANNREYYAQGIQSEVSTKFGGETLAQELTVGLRIHEDQIDRFQWVDGYKMNEGTMFQTSAGIHGTESNRIETANAFAGYAQYRIQKGKFAARPGIRYENIAMERMDYGKEDPERLGTDLNERKNTVDMWIPGISFEHFTTDKLFFFVGVHKGFTPPGTKEGTLPEESWNYELGSRWNSPGFNASVVLFYNDYINLLGVDLAAAGGQGSTDLFNAGEAQTYGLELSISYDLLTNSTKGFSLPVLLNYTHTTATFANDFVSGYEPWGTVESGDLFPYLAPDQLTLQISLEHSKFALSMNGKYTAQMRTVAGKDAIPIGTEIGSNFILDASATYRLGQQIQLFGSANNLMDDVYLVSRRPAGLRPGMPRTFMIGLKANI